MKNVFLTFLSIITLVLLNGCARLYMNEAIPAQDNNPNLLPPMTPVMDAQSLENVFGIASTSSSGSAFTNTIGSTGLSFSSGHTNSTIYRDPAIHDLTTYFEKDATTTICEQ